MISYTKVATFQMCPVKMFLRYYKRVYPKYKPANLVLGSYMHEIAQAIVRGVDFIPLTAMMRLWKEYDETAPDPVDLVWDKVKWGMRNNQLKWEMRKLYQYDNFYNDLERVLEQNTDVIEVKDIGEVFSNLDDMLNIFAEKWVGIYPQFGKLIDIEFKLNYEDFEGYADIIFEHGDVINLVEIKTARRLPTMNNLKLKFQTNLYAFVLEEQFKKPIVINYVYFKKERDVSKSDFYVFNWEFDEMREATRKAIDAYQKLMNVIEKEQIFPPNYNSCAFCEYYGYCFGNVPEFYVIRPEEQQDGHSEYLFDLKKKEG